ncbi:mRNA interferase MazF [Pricia antarctica]|uniref:mRNA interferase n=1 Tax=Pricia antarctica TaxID=641691 RepID=A0A1G7A7D3_9FLAO|nr:type II toxin-antitoxin system PemK/MazF family toxin [Pricia antarctica]SDE10593.1 mRNA interferase MazF [Pricia antarctica]
MIKIFEIWIADLNPRIDTEPGKKRPVLVVQSNLLNKIPHPSTIICPITTHTKSEAQILRVSLKRGQANLKKDSHVLIDQIRAIDNQRLVEKLGSLPIDLIDEVRRNLSIVLDLD